MGFLGTLIKGFFRSAVNQVGRDGGKVISNKVYGDKHGTPIKITQEVENKKTTAIQTFCNIYNVDSDFMVDGLINGFTQVKMSVGFETDNELSQYLKEIEENFSNLNILLDKEEVKHLNELYRNYVRVFKISWLDEKYKDELDEENLKLLIDGKYFINMSESMLIDSKGDADKIEEEVLKTKTKKTYIYGNKSSGDVLIFQNGKLVSFKDR